MRRAFTLVEIIVAASLTLLLGTVVVGYLIPALRLSGRAMSRVEMQQEATLALARLEADMRKSSLAGVSLVSVPPAMVAINPLDQVTDTGLLVWSKEFDIYYLAGDRLLRRSWPPEPPAQDPQFQVTDHAKRLPPDVLSSVVAVTAPSGYEVQLAHGVTVFRIIQDGTDDAVIQPLRFELEMLREGQTVEHLRYSRSVYLPEDRS